jgi:transposase
MFTSRIKRSKAKIKYVCMDMSNAYGTWAKAALSKAEIVYDKFHLINAMNERFDHVRRRVARNLDEDVAKDLEGKKFIFPKGEESLDENGQVALERIKAVGGDLADAYILKERLRTIYATAKDGRDAYCLLRSWCSMAEATERYSWPFHWKLGGAAKSEGTVPSCVRMSSARRARRYR